MNAIKEINITKDDLDRLLNGDEIHQRIAAEVMTAMQPLVLLAILERLENIEKLLSDGNR